VQPIAVRELRYELAPAEARQLNLLLAKLQCHEDRCPCINNSVAAHHCCNRAFTDVERIPIPQSGRSALQELLTRSQPCRRMCTMSTCNTVKPVSLVSHAVAATS